MVRSCCVSKEVVVEGSGFPWQESRGGRDQGCASQRQNEQARRGQELHKKEASGLRKRILRRGRGSPELAQTKSVGRASGNRFRGLEG